MKISGHMRKNNYVCIRGMRFQPDAFTPRGLSGVPVRSRWVTVETYIFSTGEAHQGTTMRRIHLSSPPGPTCPDALFMVAYPWRKNACGRGALWSPVGTCVHSQRRKAFIRWSAQLAPFTRLAGGCDLISLHIVSLLCMHSCSFVLLTSGQFCWSHLTRAALTAAVRLVAAQFDSILESKSRWSSLEDSNWVLVSENNTAGKKQGGRWALNRLCSLQALKLGCFLFWCFSDGTSETLPPSKKEGSAAEVTLLSFSAVSLPLTAFNRSITWSNPLLNII